MAAAGGKWTKNGKFVAASRKSTPREAIPEALKGLRPEQRSRIESLVGRINAMPSSYMLKTDLGKYLLSATKNSTDRANAIIRYYGLDKASRR